MGRGRGHVGGENTGGGNRTKADFVVLNEAAGPGITYRLET